MDIERSKFPVEIGVEDLGAYKMLGGGIKRSSFGGETCTLYYSSAIGFDGTLRSNNFYSKMFLSEWIACKQTSM